MGILRGLCWAIALAGAPGPAQAQAIKVLDVSGAFTALDERCPPAGNTGTPTRFVRLCEGMVDSTTNRSLVRLVNQNQMLVRGTAEQVTQVEMALGRLRTGDFAALQVQCTVVTLPKKAAAAFGLETNKPKLVPVEEAGRLLRIVQAEHGTLCNLPETRSLPLQPFFAIQPAAKPRPGTGDARPLPRLCVRGEGVQIDATLSRVAVQLFRGEVPADRSQLPPDPLLATAMQLRVGQGALVASVQRDQATVLWVRLVDMQPCKQ